MANKDIALNIPQITPTDFVNLVTGLALPLVHSGDNGISDFTPLPPFMMWGKPGCGKSDAGRELAQNLERATGCQVNYVDVRLLLYTQVDLKGVPVAKRDEVEKQEFTKWLVPKMFDFKKDPNVINILMLDEISACPPSIQATAYQMTLDRCVGEHKFPTNTIIICAGNRTTDKSVAYKMPRALANRLSHFEFTVDVESWLDWAYKHNIHPAVTSYIHEKGKQALDNVDADADYAYGSPRSWAKLSKMIYLYKAGKQGIKDIKKVYPFLIDGKSPEPSITQTAMTAQIPVDIEKITANIKPEMYDVTKHPKYHEYQSLLAQGASHQGKYQRALDIVNGRVQSTPEHVKNANLFIAQWQHYEATVKSYQDEFNQAKLKFDAEQQTIVKQKKEEAIRNAQQDKTEQNAYVNAYDKSISEEAMKTLGNDNILSILVSSMVGCGTAVEFMATLKFYNEVPSWEELSSGNCNYTTTNPSIRFAIASKIISHADPKNKKELENATKYLMELNGDMGNYVIATLGKIPELRDFMLESESFAQGSNNRQAQKAVLAKHNKKAVNSLF